MASQSQIEPPAKGIVSIIGPKSKVIKLLSNEQIDAEFLCQCFQDVASLQAKDILGLRMQSGLIVRLKNEKINSVIDGKVCTLELVPTQCEDDDKKTDVNISNQTGWNLLAERTQVAHWQSCGDSGNGALKAMNDWFKRNDKVRIQNIYKHFMWDGSSYHYWYGCVWTNHNIAQKQSVRGWDLRAGNTEVCHWQSTGDGGNGALKKMNDWMKANNKQLVQHIFKDFMWDGKQYHYWYGLVFLRPPSDPNSLK